MRKLYRFLWDIVWDMPDLQTLHFAYPLTSKWVGENDLALAVKIIQKIHWSSLSVYVVSIVMFFVLFLQWVRSETSNIMIKTEKGFCLKNESVMIMFFLKRPLSCKILL